MHRGQRDRGTVEEIKRGRPNNERGGPDRRLDLIRSGNDGAWEAWVGGWVREW
jgi:hypothetical protein